MSGPARVACITLDSAEQSLLLKWVNRGLLPHFGKLLEESVSSATRNPEIIYSGTLWPSFNTGVWPGRHNHYCYLQPDSQGYGLRRFLPEHLSVDSIWNAIAQQGHRVALVDVPDVRLARTSQTLQVSFWGEHVVRHPLTCWPPSLEQEVRQVAGTDPVGACDLVRQRPHELRRLKEGLIERATRRADLALAVLARGPWDLFALNFSEAHCAGHQLWAAHDPTHPQYRTAFRGPLGEDPLLEVYQAIDRSLARIVDALGEDAFLLVLATQGMGPRYDANAALDSVLRRLDGIDVPKASGLMETMRKMWLQLPGVVRGPLRRVADLLYDAPRQRERASRRFYAIPTLGNCGGVRLNLRGREPKGLVEPGLPCQELCDWLERELLALVNTATGAPAVTCVLRGDLLFAGPFRNQFPDLVIEWNYEAPIPAIRSQRVGELRVESPNPRTGDHRPKGLVLARSQDLAPHALEGDKAVVDLAPTLAARLGVELSGIDGKPTLDFLPQHTHV
ncbi:MAG: alkaline phosphatase family protein [Nitrospiraceae bacterium]|nr:alkaline phosphatase family protein [Nitrospiraceae bacterium]